MEKIAFVSVGPLKVTTILQITHSEFCTNCRKYKTENKNPPSYLYGTCNHENSPSYVLLESLLAAPKY
jgi:hypothetical protein